VDGIRRAAADRGVVGREFGVRGKGFALLVLHPADGDVAAEEVRARVVLDAVLGEFDQVVVVYPNNDPGSEGIVKVWRELEGAGIEGVVVRKDVPRDRFLGLMRDAAVLVGNSSSGIIEAASFGTPVVDVGPRQQGRERSGNVAHVGYDRRAIGRAVRGARGSRWRGENVYGGGQAGVRMARILAGIELDGRLRHKLIAY
jgi:GDP/UDP-N,N'-diacetylbacillosamine 2-epimerase (hydrolysing)